MKHILVLLSLLSIAACGATSPASPTAPVGGAPAASNFNPETGGRTGSK